MGTQAPVPVPVHQHLKHNSSVKLALRAEVVMCVWLTPLLTFKEDVHEKDLLHWKQMEAPTADF